MGLLRRRYPQNTLPSLPLLRDTSPRLRLWAKLLLLASFAYARGVAQEPDQVAETTAIEQSPAVDAPEKRPNLLGAVVRSGLFDYRHWSSAQSLDGLAVPAPVLIVGGIRPGPTLCLTGAIHGDELNGVEIIRRVLFGLDAEKINGNVIGIPIVNLHGFRRNSRYLADRRDLNRFFPGDPSGSSASRIAHSLFTEVIRHCDYLVDIHTGSFQRTNLAQLRADVTKPSVLRLAQMFGDVAVLNHPGAPGTLRRAATQVGIAAVTIEVGEPLRLQPDQVDIGVRGIKSVLAGLGMSVQRASKHAAQTVYYETSWVRADDSGILLAKVDVGEHVRVGQVLGTVTDPITNRRGSIVSPFDGRVLGMAINQVVMPGFAAFHLGREAARTIDEAEPTPSPQLEPATDAVERGSDAPAHSPELSTDDEPATEPSGARGEAPPIDTEPDDHPE